MIYHAGTQTHYGLKQRANGRNAELDPSLDPYPEGYLARLAASGVDGVWLQAVLTRLVPFPWDAQQSEGYKTCLKDLALLVERARRHGVGVYLYLNEPRSCPTSFFATRPSLKGVAEGDFAALCMSATEVREWLSSAVETICRAAPGLAGFFTITGSENMTSSWSHGSGKACPRCGNRAPACRESAFIHRKRFWIHEEDTRVHPAGAGAIFRLPGCR